MYRSKESVVLYPKLCTKLNGVTTHNSSACTVWVSILKEGRCNKFPFGLFIGINTNLVQFDYFSPAHPGFFQRTLPFIMFPRKSSISVIQKPLTTCREKEEPKLFTDLKHLINLDQKGQYL
jgi:hypothetical protein